MNNDFYSEQLVTKKSDGKDMAKKIAIGLAAVILSAFVFLVFFYFLPMNLIVIGIIFYFAFYLMGGVDTEYEYIITNGDIDIDKISGKRRRKRLLSASISDFTAFGRLSEANEAPNGATTVLVTDGMGKNEYYADFKHKTAGDVRIIFTPDEKTVNGVVTYLPRQLKAEYRRKNG